jgi:hypothetical protein
MGEEGKMKASRKSLEGERLGRWEADRNKETNGRSVIPQGQANRI